MNQFHIFKPHKIFIIKAIVIFIEYKFISPYLLIYNFIGPLGLKIDRVQDIKFLSNMAIYLMDILEMTRHAYGHSRDREQ